jgi:hypothetical protein
MEEMREKKCVCVCMRVKEEIENREGRERAESRGREIGDESRESREERIVGVSEQRSK